MTIQIQYPLVNGVRHSGTVSIELKLGGLIFVGFKSINYSRTRSRGTVYGNNVDPIAKTRGKNEYKGDCELYFAEWSLFQQHLGPGYGDKPFPVFVTYNEVGFDPITDILIGCNMDSTEASNSDGTDPTARKFDLTPIKIRFGRIDDNATPLQAPQT
jgi:hypothetical protein